MTRALLPGRWNRHGRAVPLNACTGNCNQGRACTCETELADTTPLRARSVVLIRPAITVHRIPLTRRARRFGRALLDFLTAPCFRL